MFQVDQKVWIKNKNCEGTIVYMEGTYIVVELSNGVEMDTTPVNLEDLTDHNIEVDRSEKVANFDFPPGHPIYSLVWGEIEKLSPIIVSLAQRTQRSDEPVRNWKNLPSYDKINYVIKTIRMTKKKDISMKAILEANAAGSLKEAL